MTTSVGNNSVFRSFFEKQKLTGPNFIDWYKQLRLVLSTEDKENYLEQPIPEAHVAPLGQQVPPAAAAAHAAWVKGQKEVVVLMLLTMDLDIQRNLAHLGAYDMLQELKAMFSKQAEQELLQTVREFHACKQEEVQSLALTFVQNYNMHGMGKTVNELHAMLKLHKDTLPKKDVNPTLHAIRAGRVQKSQKNKPHKAAKGGQGKGKSKMGYAPNNAPFAPKPKTPPPPKKDNPAKDVICHQCGKIGHWRRNCPVYLAELMKKKKLSQGASTSGIFTIELYSFPSKSWIYDTCCGTHICITTQGLRGSKKLKPGALNLYVGDGHRAAIEAIGTYHLELPSGLVIVLNNCHYAPSITRGVISVSRLFDDGFINRFDENNVISVSNNNLVYFMAVPRDGIFKIDMSCSNTNDSSMYAISSKRAKINLDSSLLWHCRLGHISKKRIEKLQHDGLLNSIDIESLGKCVSCLSGKMARKPYSHQVERAKDLLGLIHTDVCGPFRIVSRQGANYFVTFTDDFSRYGYVYLLKHKHEVFETFKVFQKEVENQLGKTIKSLRSDRGGEYMSQEFLDHLKEHGIIAHRTPPYTPQHNGVSERRNQTLLDMVRSMMSQTTLPKSFWDYALETAARILNMVPTKKVDKTPYEIWHGQAPKLSYLKVWGYPKETMEYSFYSPSENKIFVARNAEFFESDLIDLKASGSVEDLELIQEEDTNPSLDTSLNHEEGDQEIDEPQSDINPIRKSTRTRRVPNRMCLYIDAEEHELGDLGEPANYKAALMDPESKKWLDVMNVEMQSMKDNDVWVLVELPPNAITVSSKWFFKKKTNMDGAVYVFKARLVAKGFTQTYEVDYEETFSHVAHIRAIRILIAIAAYYDYEIWKIDVKTAFLNRHLSKEVYMEQPEGFVNLKYPNHVCKLKRSIYGLKQASRQWNKRFDDEIKKFGFTQNPDEPCVYKKASGSYVAILILYVDDILLMGNNIPMLQDVKSYLGRSFAMKDLGEAAYILGIKIYRDRSKRLIGLCQSAYIEKILKIYYMENSKRGTILMQEKLKLSKSQGASTHAEKQRMQNIPYASAIGSIMYAVRCTRPDVAFAQNITSRFQQNPGEEHWTAVKNILKYLRDTKDTFLVYGGNMERELRVSCYTDAGYLTDADDLKSQTGYVFVLNGGVVNWKSTKQSIFATSSTDAEYIVAFDASKEAVWIRKFIYGLSIVPTIEEPINMYCDNT
ncbi:retrotransposon protein, putative, ty1-copia subclass [Tanacetum coccineum]|uniref:Retrotransposon protein, putative, ty1-copia subclass n=1 Tax=Tanacetum coccineum TaxID=301880 RepID=A0ABQ4XMD7_9ASTR